VRFYDIEKAFSNSSFCDWQACLSSYTLGTSNRHWREWHEGVAEVIATGGEEDLFWSTAIATFDVSRV